MSNHDYVIANGTGAAVRSDLNNALAAIVSNNSSSSEPSTRYAYQWWADTTTNKLKLRNSANNAWNTICELDGTMLMEDGTATSPGLAFESDENSGLFTTGADKINFATGGVERLEIGSSEVVFNDTSNDVDFRVESNGQSHMLFVDAGNDRIGIGVSSPSYLLDLETAADSQLRIKSSSGSSSHESAILLQRGSNESAIKNKAGGLEFFTGGLTTEDMRLDSSGRLLVGTSADLAPDGFGSKIQSAALDFTASITTRREGNNTSGTVVNFVKTRSTSLGGNTVVQSGDMLGGLNFYGADGTDANSLGGYIRCLVDGTPGSNDMPGRLEFATTADGAASPTERMRIDASGNVLVGTSNTNPSGNNVSGIALSAGGRVSANINGDAHRFGRAQGGDILQFQAAGSTEGSISISGTTTSYNGGHLARWSQLPGGVERTEILRGSVLSNLDEMCEWGEENNEQLNRMQVSTVEGDKNVAGVFQAWDDDDDIYTNDFYCAMTGDFVIRIAQGTTVARGDLLMSAGDGTAKPQDDDIVRSKTIAKVTSTTVSETYADNSYCVPCVLMAC